MDKLIRLLGGVPKRQFTQLEEDYNDLLKSFSRLMDATNNKSNERAISRIAFIGKKDSEYDNTVLAWDVEKKRKRGRPRKV